MLDSDVALLYNYTTKRINEAVRRNTERFPENFCFKLTQDEVENLKKKFVTLNLEENNWSQIATSSNSKNSKYRGKKYLPYAFTEQGIAMLSGLLRSEVAVQVSINIMNAFVEMRKFISINGQVFERLTNIEYKLLEHDSKFNQVFNALQCNKETESIQKVFFNGQIYDSYEVIINIIKRAENKITIIDNYIDDSILSMLSKKKESVEVIILTSINTNLTKLDINKFNKQYPCLKIIKTNKFHDRFIIIDSKELYHIGASLKDLGKKCFAISKIEDNEYVNKLNSFIVI
ncbi:MAG: ORF6N domain-containing protein [Clostridia bacterium]|nr:ORF6N domain-containing protein [Clostridia bacterium]